MAKQTTTGKAFEYALLKELYVKIISLDKKVEIINNDPYNSAKNCFESFSVKEKELYSSVSNKAVEFLIDIEPRLINEISDLDTLELEILSDSEGQSGDVRDVIAIRLSQKWEIGVSAKNNHRAVKHSRLSQNIDFGNKWVGIPCSDLYFDEIKPIFDFLSEIKFKDRSTKWTSISDMHNKIYVPLLNAFSRELIRLDHDNPTKIPHKLVEYLIGNKDFYKVIKGRNKVEIQAYNLHGTLNQSIGNIRPKARIPKLKLPSRLIDIVYKENSKTTLIVTLDEGWQISFRIHNASSRVEPSLKFDINLISAPHTLFTNHIFIS
ncbi:MAG: HaeIII family restriction endonuclease [Fermentimonas sp.]|nr:HaeIII family restriction endonuclease [Fermentimonas sp.]MDD4283489.1 HaeIII family restriction endonuclease [Fermentimonas sp.]MDD4724003.1 HaeIII family restriction endonuclease [Fermentimonas sp.]